MKEVLSSIFFLVLVGGLLWGWNYWRETSQNTKDTRASIDSLVSDATLTIPRSQESVEPDTTVTPGADEKKQDVAPTDAIKAVLDVKVINGGAVKGSATKVQGILKQNGYAKAQAGNSLTDHTGVAVYYSGANEALATAIQQLLMKEYPKTSVQASTSPKAENGSASVVVILGK
jgi:hypothetical protein